MWTIYTRRLLEKKFTKLMGDFKTAAEAMIWLTETFQDDAEFWHRIAEFKITWTEKV